LEANNFEVRVVEDAAQARAYVMEELMPQLRDANGPENAEMSVSWGGTMTFKELGLYDAFVAGEGPTAGLRLLDPYQSGLPREEILELRRQALLTDLYVTGVNAITAAGQLVNLDMIGNRVAALTFGPRNVLVLAGRNKLVDDLNSALARIKEFCAPVNAMRLDKKTPCVKTGRCDECKSPDRICNSWTITEKSFPKGRIKIVLVNADLGL
jgi:hypothetical protein